MVPESSGGTESGDQTADKGVVLMAATVLMTFMAVIVARYLYERSRI